MDLASSAVLPTSVTVEWIFAIKRFINELVIAISSFAFFIISIIFSLIFAPPVILRIGSV
jgi:hypothetical protein